MTRIGLAILVASAAASTGWAQTSSFEIATVRPNHTGESQRSFPRMQNGTFTAQAASLKALISIAYGMSDLRIDGPDWINTEKFDITAKAPMGVADSQMAPLLQTLLRDRFHLKTHVEMKETPVYSLVVGKGGAKLKPFDPAHPSQSPPNRGQAIIIGGGTTSQLANILVRAVERPVLDRTGMQEQGRFSWTLEFAPMAANDNPAVAVAPDIFTAVEEQLGLKLQSTREPLEILVVERADRVPTEN